MGEKIKSVGALLAEMRWSKATAADRHEAGMKMAAGRKKKKARRKRGAK